MNWIYFGRMWKSILLLASFILANGLVNLSWSGDNEYGDRNKPLHVKLKLEQESHLVINGETNVNSFQCLYENSLKKDTLDMNAYWQDNCLIFENARLNLATNAFDCGNNQMNKDLQNLLQTDNYPYITIDLDCIHVLNPSQQEVVSYHNRSRKITILADITIAGTTREQLLPVEIYNEGNERNYTGTISINLNDFNIKPPTKMLGLIKVNENIEVNFFVKVALLESELTD